MDPEEIMVSGTLAAYLSKHASYYIEDNWYAELILWFPRWVEENPQDAARFKGLLADAIVTGDVRADQLSGVCGHVTAGASPADVDSALRAIWFDLWADDPIPGDPHPLPPWWWRWDGTPFISAANGAGPWTDPALREMPIPDISPPYVESLTPERVNGWVNEESGNAIKVAYMATHPISIDDVLAHRALFVALTAPDGNLRREAGYMRMMRARWEADDTSTEPTVPPDPADVAQCEGWVGWLPED